MDAGHSLGGVNALRYASLYDDVPRVINISGRIVSFNEILKMEPSEIQARLERDGKIDIKTPRADGTFFTRSLSKEVDVKQRVRQRDSRVDADRGDAKGHRNGRGMQADGQDKGALHRRDGRHLLSS